MSYTVKDSADPGGDFKCFYWSLSILMSQKTLYEDVKMNQ